MVYQITTKPGDLKHDYRAFGEWEEASDREEMWFVTIDETQSDALESLLDTDDTVITYEVVSVEA